MTTSAECTIVLQTLSHYRVSFLEALSTRLQDESISLRVIVGQPDKISASRNDTSTLPWAEMVTNHHLGVGHRELIWQPCLAMVRTSDLVVVTQASSLLVNYALLAWRRLGGPKVAYWGHGLNLDIENASRLGEAVKRRFASKADWWFCYTEGTAKIVSTLGVPLNRLTVVQNAIDTSRLRAAHESLSRADVAAIRKELGIGAGPVAVWISSIYKGKRPTFMIEAADRIRSQINDFEFIVIGDGPDRHIFDHASTTRPWLHVLGAGKGLEIVGPASTATLLVNPGLVGLTVLDGFALGLPMVTCGISGHGPEIEYLESGVNGLVLPSDSSPQHFADSCVELLSQESELKRLSDNARQSSFVYTLEEMVERFSAGIKQAIALGPQGVRHVSPSRILHREIQRRTRAL
jgi:L-malate glycosyltransferase